MKKSPWWLRGMNGVWRGLYPVGGKVRLEKDDLIRRARKITGFKDFGSTFNEEPIERLLWSLNEEADLHPAGRFVSRERLVSLLNIRLRAEHYFKKFPEILEQELYPAWIIVGLQRTGTTKLHRLLATDPDHRVIPSWEVINPIPLTRPGEVITDPAGAWGDSSRLKLAHTAVKAVQFMSPGFFAIHPIDPVQPEEDILLLDVSFLSTTPEAITHVPSYASWLEQTDQSEAYAYAVKLLKFLQWIRPAKRWVLKTPHHLEFPDLIEKHFNEVHFLWPHRNIYESVPSFLSMVTYNRLMFSDQVSVTEVANHWVRKTGYMLDRALTFRSQPGHERLFTDIWYQDLVGNSMEELGKIYRLNGGLNSGLEERFLRHEKEHPHQKHGVHRYSLADFGLTEQDVDRHTSHYQQFINAKYDRESAGKI